MKRGGLPLGPGETWEVNLPFAFHRFGVQPRMAAEGDQVAVIFEYLDASGREWRRRANEQPVRVLSTAGA